MPGDENTDRSFWTPARILTTIVVFALVATLGYTFLGGGAEVSTSSNVALPGSPASSAPAKVVPPDFEVPTIDGGKLKLSSYRGKVLVVDFWATWCGPCREEVPQLVRLARDNRDRGIEVIGLHIDDQGRSSPADIRKFMTQ
ncbi:MAG TPA: TlpA disulfide reductase family protein, partial [Blastocatellia bacterium]|nr:TlpA disulfide reductase family protein [Blastocatellia bacterium]